MKFEDMCEIKNYNVYILLIILSQFVLQKYICQAVMYIYVCAKISMTYIILIYLSLSIS